MLFNQIGLSLTFWCFVVLVTLVIVFWLLKCCVIVGIVYVYFDLLLCFGFLILFVGVAGVFVVCLDDVLLSAWMFRFFVVWVC